jgi:RNA polymerase sigma-70 factor (ECF subfamily)
MQPSGREARERSSPERAVDPPAVRPAARLAAPCGDPAFEDFVREHERGLQALAAAYLRDSSEAEDVVQAAFLKTWERWGAMAANPRLGAWVARVVRNECIDRRRRQRLQRRYELSVLATSERAEPDAGLASAEGDASDLERVWKAVLDMPDPYRSVLILRFGEGLSYQQIARSLDLPLGTVKTHVARAVRRVRLRLFPETRHED